MKDDKLMGLDNKAEKLSDEKLKMVSGGTDSGNEDESSQGMPPGHSTVQVQKPWENPVFVPPIETKDDGKK